MTALLLLIACSLASAADWPQFGGPTGDFQPLSSALHEWPEGGPRKLWERPLGLGYSGVALEDRALYTMYRKGSNEAVIKLDASTGETLWEFAYDAPVLADFKNYGGDGPRATPLLLAGKLVTAGANGKLHCLDARTGKVIWKRDVYQDFGGSVRNSGYSPSPFAWHDLVIVFPGTKDAAVAALRQSDGSVVWKKHARTVSFATPATVRFAKKDYLVVLFAEEIAGLDPETGEKLWSFPHTNSELVSVAKPLWLGDGMLFLSSAYDGSCRVIQLSDTEGKVKAEEVWSNRLLRIHHTNAIAFGDMVLGASGDFGPTPLTALEAKTGKLLWRDRTFPKASMVRLGDRLLILDEEGTLALAIPQTDGLKVIGKTKVLNSTAWTAPTVVGKRVYVRDQKTIGAWSFE